MRYVLIAVLLSGCAGSQYAANEPMHCDYVGTLGAVCGRGTPLPVGPSNIGAFDQPKP